MNFRDQTLLDLKSHGRHIEAPLNVYCALGSCNVLIRKGTPCVQMSGCDFIHETCPKGGVKNFAAHKYL